MEKIGNDKRIWEESWYVGNPHTIIIVDTNSSHIIPNLVKQCGSRRHECGGIGPTGSWGERGVVM